MIDLEAIEAEIQKIRNKESYLQGKLSVMIINRKHGLILDTHEGQLLTYRP